MQRAIRTNFRAMFEKASTTYWGGFCTGANRLLDARAEAGGVLGAEKEKPCPCAERVFTAGVPPNTPDGDVDW